jgi:hypothetical protein
MRPGRCWSSPVADIAQHLLASLCFFVQNGYAVDDDVHRRKIPGLEQFAGLVEVEEPVPLTFAEQYALTEATAELASACYAGVLLLQAMGLGGWIFDGIDRFSMLGASGNPDVPGLGFATTPTSAGPPPTPPAAKGCSRPTATPLPGHGGGGGGPGRAQVRPRWPFHPDTPGAWSDSPGFRGSAQVHDEAFKACVALQAQYVYDTFGKFPGTAPTLFILNYLQAHHLDLEFYDRFFTPGATPPAHPRRAHGPLAPRDGEGLRWGKHVGPGRWESQLQKRGSGRGWAAILGRPPSL